MYSPSGHLRETSGSLKNAPKNGSVNRVRREPAVSGSLNANSRSNSRNRGSSFGDTDTPKN